MGRILGFISKLLIGAVISICICVGIILSDGLKDRGTQADVALVSLGDPSAVEPSSDALRPLLDKVAGLLAANDLTTVYVTGSGRAGDDPKDMAAYLQQHGVAATAVVSIRGETTDDIAHQVADAMKKSGYNAVIIIAPYYHVTFIELALVHEGVKQIGKSHVGELRKEDAEPIARDMIALYSFLMKYYVMPTVDKVRQEVQSGFDKSKVDAQKAKDDVNHKLDSMSK